CDYLRDRDRYLFIDLHGQEHRALVGCQAGLVQETFDRFGEVSRGRGSLMAMKPTDFDGAQPVDGYGPGFFRVGGEVLHGAVVVQAGGARPWGGTDDRASLLALAGKIDVLFLGMGKEIAHPPADLLQALE